MRTHIYIYIYTHIHTYTYTYTYAHIYSERSEWLRTAPDSYLQRCKQWGFVEILEGRLARVVLIIIIIIIHNSNNTNISIMITSNDSKTIDSHMYTSTNNDTTCERRAPEVCTEAWSHSRRASASEYIYVYICIYIYIYMYI